MKELRKQTRIETKALVDYTGTNAVLDHKIRDLSMGGMRIETEFLEDEGAAVDLYISLPEIGKSFEAEGVVVWVKLSPPKEMGIKFLSLSNETRVVLKEYIAFLAGRKA